ncbi:MAG: hypothetical protein NTY04_02885 [Candidatus Staskawiczbacteria bacterium]|nr:hypothetical protein [Candidatus Staskawiczbacteria bacterium]
MTNPEKKSQGDRPEEEISSIVASVPPQEVAPVDVAPDDAIAHQQEISREVTSPEQEVSSAPEAPSREVAPEFPAEEHGLKERAEKAKAKAVEVLSDPEVMKKDPKELEEAFFDLTGKDLIAERDRLVEENLKNRHAMVIRGKEAIEAHKAKIIEEETQAFFKESHTMATNTVWERKAGKLTEAEQLTLTTKIKKKLGLQGVEGDIAFDQLTNNGFDLEKAGVNWFTGKIKLPHVSGPGALTYPDSKTLLEKVVGQANLEANEAARIRADEKIKEGRKRLVAERLVCTKTVIEKAVAEHSLDQQKKQAEEVESENNNRVIGEEEIKGAFNIEELLSLLSKGGKIMGKKREGQEQLAHNAKEQGKGIESILTLFKEFEPDVRKKYLANKNNMLFTTITQGCGLRAKMIEEFSKIFKTTEVVEEKPAVVEKPVAEKKPKTRLSSSKPRSKKTK